MFAKEIYISRRERLMQKMGKGLILLLGNSEASTNYPSNTYKFRQDSTFLYFFGHNEPDLAAILDPETGDQILFGNNVDMDDIIWMGPQPTVAEKGAKVGISHTEPFAALGEYLKKAQQKLQQDPSSFIVGIACSIFERGGIAGAYQGCS